MSDLKKNQDPLSREFHSHPHVSWIVETRGIHIINKQTNRTCFLNYPRAAIWDLMTRDNSFDRIITFISIISSVNRIKARQLVCESVEEWIKKGFLLKKCKHD
jgi:hypothetical protein